MKRTPYLDMYTLPEDKRIQLIGDIACTKVTGVMLEKNELAKIARYIEKVTKRFPEVRHIDTTDVPDTKNLIVMVRFGPKGN
jgi:hypothetical protein